LKRAGGPPRAFVELKAPGKPADPTRWRGQDQRQFKRFQELPYWATSNFSEIRLFNRADQTDYAEVVPEGGFVPIVTMSAPTARLPTMIPFRFCAWSKNCLPAPDKSRRQRTRRNWRR
jgi:hypothetical protein